VSGSCPPAGWLDDDPEIQGTVTENRVSKEMRMAQKIRKGSKKAKALRKARALETVKPFSGKHHHQQPL
jgi:hypothetical protein